MGDLLAGKHPVVARVLGWSVVALTAHLAYDRLMEAEPEATLASMVVVGVFGVLGVAVFVAVVMAWNVGARVLLVVAPVVFLVGLAAHAVAEPVHWRWSRTEFAAVGAGADVRCAPATECRLGWWRISGSARYDEMVIVWLADAGGCYMGHGLAMPLDGADDEEAVAASATRIDGPSDLVIVNPWREGWYELCFIS